MTRHKIDIIALLVSLGFTGIIGLVSIITDAVPMPKPEHPEQASVGNREAANPASPQTQIPVPNQNQANDRLPAAAPFNLVLQHP